MRKGIWTATGSAWVAALLASSAAPAAAASLAVPKGGSTANICYGDCFAGPPRYYYRAYRPYYSQYYWRPHYHNTIISDQPFHAQPVPWWVSGYTQQHYYIGPAFGY